MVYKQTVLKDLLGIILRSDEQRRVVMVTVVYSRCAENRSIMVVNIMRRYLQKYVLTKFELWN
jgi:hypothetical protein